MLERNFGQSVGILKDQVVKVDKGFAPNPWAYESKTGKMEFVATAINKSPDSKIGIPHYEDIGIDSEGR
jgi:hypothetical protein